MPITRHLPHRTGRRAFLHPAPTLDVVTGTTSPGCDSLWSLCKSQAMIGLYSSAGGTVRMLGMKRHSTEAGGRELAAYRIGCRHWSALLSRPSFPTRDHSACDLLLSPVPVSFGVPTFFHRLRPRGAARFLS